MSLTAIFSQPSRIVLRHLSRWPLRSALTILGVALSGMVLVGMLFFFDAVEYMIQTEFFKAQRQDLTLAFAEPQPSEIVREVARLPAVMTAEPVRQAKVWLRYGQRAKRTALQGLPLDARLHRILDRHGQAITLPADGLVLSGKMAEILGASRGSMVTVEFLEGRRSHRDLPVSAIVEEYIGAPAYINLAALNRFERDPDLVTGVNLQIDSSASTALFRQLKSLPVVAGITNKPAAVAMFRQTMAESLNIMLGFYVFFGGMIAVGVVYNSARISFAERSGDLACLRVLGFTKAEVSYILLAELAVVTLIALPLGGLLGSGMAWYLAQAFDSELYRVPLVIQNATYALAAAVVIGASAVSGLLVRRRVDRMDLIAVLKTRE